MPEARQVRATASTCGWLRLYAVSMGLGLRALLRGRDLREAAVRLAIPLEDSRLIELPATLTRLRVSAGERVLDLASPKLLSVALARRGARVVSVDELPEEIEVWRRLAGRADVEFRVADGRALPLEAGTVDHAYSISVLEHIAEPGDEEALRELARVVRPGGRVVLTLPYDTSRREDWRERPAYLDHGDQDGRYFFARVYDDDHLARLTAAAPDLREIDRTAIRFAPSRLYDAVRRHWPWSIPLAFFAPLFIEVERGPGGVVLLTLERRGAPAARSPDA